MSLFFWTPSFLSLFLNCIIQNGGSIAIVLSATVYKASIYTLIVAQNSFQGVFLQPISNLTILCRFEMFFVLYIFTDTSVSFSIPAYDFPFPDLMFCCSPWLPFFLLIFGLLSSFIQMILDSEAVSRIFAVCFNLFTSLVLFL